MTGDFDAQRRAFEQRHGVGAGSSREDLARALAEQVFEDGETDFLDHLAREYGFDDIMAAGRAARRKKSAAPGAHAIYK